MCSSDLQASGDPAATDAPGADASTCPAGTKLYYGQCVPIQQKEGGGGCAGGTLPLPSSIAPVMALLAGLALARRRRNP